MLVTGANSPDDPFEVMKRGTSGGTFPVAKDSSLEAKKTAQQNYNKTMRLAVGMNYQRKQMEGDKSD